MTYVRIIVIYFTPGGNLTIHGSSFTNKRGSILIGSEFGEVTLWTDNRIELTVGGIESGWHEIRISGTYGYAVNK